MAIYNEILAGRFARGIQKIFSMKGGVPTRQLSGEVMPVFELDDATALENRFLHSFRSFALKQTAPANVGTQSAVRIRNPAGSNVVAIIEKITIVTSALDNPFINRGITGTADLGTVVQANVRDVRMGAVGSSCSLSNSNNAAVVGFTWWQGGAAAANAMLEVINDSHQELVIGPSDVMTVYCNVVNQAITVSLFWRERSLEESELSA